MCSSSEKLFIYIVMEIVCTRRRLLHIGCMFAFKYDGQRINAFDVVGMAALCWKHQQFRLNFYYAYLHFQSAHVNRFMDPMNIHNRREMYGDG